MEVERSVEISNRHGLHARASTRLAQEASKFRASISVWTKDSTDKVDAKSILGILTLGAERGQTLCIRAEGEDALQAMDALLSLVERNFGEE